MKSLREYKTILWDFDGVILDSMPIREFGFREVLKKYPHNQVDALIQFHKQNGGLSRYVKFRYFFEEIRQEKVDTLLIDRCAKDFSELMISKLNNESLLIKDSVEFIRSNHHNLNMHIVSGSDQKELRNLCRTLGISDFFISIHGSPSHKNDLVSLVLDKNNYNQNEVILIGDSINDYEAADKNKIAFLGYNNPNLKTLGCRYIESFYYHEIL